MGQLIWSQWAKLIALTAGVFEVVAGIFGCFYRLAMFEPVTTMYDGLINPVNIIAIICIVLGLIVVTIELRVRTLYILRGFFYTVIGVFSLLDYQSVNPGLYMVIAALMYTIAGFKREGRSARRFEA